MSDLIVTYSGTAPAIMACGGWAILCSWVTGKDSISVSLAAVLCATSVGLWVQSIAGILSGEPYNLEWQTNVLEKHFHSFPHGLSLRLAGVGYITITLFVSLYLIPLALRKARFRVLGESEQLEMLLYTLACSHILSDTVLLLHDWCKLALLAVPFLIARNIRLTHLSNVIAWYCWATMNGLDSLSNPSSSIKLVMTSLTCTLTWLVFSFIPHKSRAPILNMSLNALFAVCTASTFLDAVQEIVWLESVYEGNSNESSMWLSSVSWDEAKQCLIHFPASSQDLGAGAVRCTPSMVIALSIASVLRLLVAANGPGQRVAEIRSMIETGVGLYIGLLVYKGAGFADQLTNPYMVALLLAIMQGNCTVHIWESKYQHPFNTQTEQITSKTNGIKEHNDSSSETSLLDLNQTGEVSDERYREVAQLDVNVHQLVHELQRSSARYNKIHAKCLKSHLAESAASLTKLCIAKTTVASKQVQIVQQVRQVLAQSTRERDIMRVARDTTRGQNPQQKARAKDSTDRSRIQTQIERAVDKCIRTSHELDQVCKYASACCQESLELHRKALEAVRFESEGSAGTNQSNGDLAGFKFQLGITKNKLVRFLQLCEPQSSLEPRLHSFSEVGRVPSEEVMLQNIRPRTHTTPTRLSYSSLPLDTLPQTSPLRGFQSSPSLLDEVAQTNLNFETARSSSNLIASDLDLRESSTSMPVSESQTPLNRVETGSKTVVDQKQPSHGVPVRALLEAAALTREDGTPSHHRKQSKPRLKSIVEVTPVTEQREFSSANTKRKWWSPKRRLRKRSGSEFSTLSTGSPSSVVPNSPSKRGILNKVKLPFRRKAKKGET